MHILSAFLTSGKICFNALFRPTQLKYMNFVCEMYYLAHILLKWCMS